MKICMIGTGYVGLVSGTCFADLGNKVYCVDKDKSKINKLKNSISPIYEPGLEDLIKNNLRAKRLIFTDDLKKAIFDFDLVLASCGRIDVSKDSFFESSEDIFNWVLSYKKINNLAIIFGREDRGLTNNELLLANKTFNIPKFLIEKNNLSNIFSLNS